MNSRKVEGSQRNVKRSNSILTQQQPELVSVIQDLLTSVGTEEERANEKLAMVTGRLRELLHQHQGHVTSPGSINNSIAETPPRFSRSTSQDQNIVSAESNEFFREVSKTLEKINKEGLKSKRKPAPLAPF